MMNTAASDATPARAAMRFLRGMLNGFTFSDSAATAARTAFLTSDCTGVKSIRSPKQWQLSLLPLTISTTRNAEKAASSATASLMAAFGWVLTISQTPRKSSRAMTSLAMMNEAPREKTPRLKTYSSKLSAPASLATADNMKINPRSSRKNSLRDSLCICIQQFLQGEWLCSCNRCTSCPDRELRCCLLALYR